MSDNPLRNRSSRATKPSPQARRRRPPEPEAELAALAKALGHPARVSILRHLLLSAECLCGELCERLPLAQSTVSQHLKILKEAGLIVGTIQRPRICYCANPERLRRFADLLDELLGAGSSSARCESDCKPPARPRRGDAGP